MVIRGWKNQWVEMGGSAVHVDYIAGTSKCWPTWFVAGVECRARNGYQRAVKSVCEEAVLMWSPDRPDMGYHVVVSGPKASAWIEKVMAGKCKIARIDIAFDLAAGSPTIAELFSEHQAGRVVCRAREYQYIQSPSGNTLYLGSRTSGTFVRCYDSRGFTRVEYEFKGTRAQQVAELWQTCKERVSEACLAAARWVTDSATRAVRSRIAEWCRQQIAEAIFRLPAVQRPLTVEKFVKWWRSLGAARVVADSLAVEMESGVLRERHYELLNKAREFMGASLDPVWVT